MTFTVHEALKPHGLKGISEDQIDQHWELYKGYVKNTNELMAELAQLERGTRQWSEVKRRAAFELDGIVLHERYFENLKAGTHELVAFFTGQGPHERDYKRGATIKFDKGTDPKYIELRIKDSSGKIQPEFDVKIWQ